MPDRLTLVEVCVATAVVLIGVALTSYGAVTHAGWTSAPGATATLVRCTWFGNVLARRDFPLLGH